MNKLCIAWLCLLLSLGVSATEACHENCTFLLMNDDGERLVEINKERLHKKLPPFSTFKIPNSLIAIELGIISSPEQKLSFDTEAHPVQSWWPEVWYKEPLSARDAFQRSALPIYQDLAIQVGETRMEKFVTDFAYGNSDISSGIDTFWLNGSLRISAAEQVDFLTRLHNRKLPVSDKTYLLFREMMLAEQTDEFSLFAKTGAGQLSTNRVLGWYVGFVETKKGTYYFALNIEGTAYDQVLQQRISIVRDQLAERGII